MNFKETVSQGQELVELPELIAALRDGFDEAEYSLCNWETADSVRQGQNLFLDLRGEAQHAHDLGYAGAGDTLPAGDVGLVGDLAGRQEGLPLDGLAEESTTRGVLGSLGGLGLPRQGGMVLTIWSAGARRVRVPTLPFSKSPLGPRAISTVCSR